MTAATIHADDLYERLGIERAATREEVRGAYRALLRRYPPERAPEEFKRIREAYETLNDPASREEYDRAPSAAVQRLLRLASASMEAEAYPDAEQHLKRVLVEDPTLDFARNWLGLCFLYQEKAEQALPQFERLLQRGDPAPAWFGNAGHAYARLARFPAAEAMFQRAIAAADAEGEDVTSYYVALADLYVERKDLDAAEAVLEKAIRHDGEVDFADLQYFTKLLEVQLYRKDAPRVNAVLHRIKLVARDPQQREYTAWKLATLASQLVVAGVFPLAWSVGQAGLELQPGDSDYHGLVQLASLLVQRRPAQADQLMRHHGAFQDGGWLAGMVPAVRRHLAELSVFGEMKPISGVPLLGTINTIGTHLYGERDYDPESRSHVATLYFVVFFIPLVPLGCYRVIPAGDNSWRFLGKVPFSDREKKHLAAALVVGFLLFIGMAVASASAPSSSSSSYGGSAAALTEQVFENPLPAVPGGGDATSPASDVDTDPVSDPVPTRAYVPFPTQAWEQRNWINDERVRLRQTEAELEKLRGQADAAGSEIDDLAAQIRRIEGSAPAGGLPANEYARYQSLIRRHNTLVAEHERIRRRFERRNADYQVALAEINRRIDQYNANH